LDAKTLILGNSRDAREIAEELLEMDGDVIVAMPGNTGDIGLFDSIKAGKKADRLEVLPVAGSVSCSGTVGRFSLTFPGHGEPLTRTVSSIIIADDAVRRPNFSLYGVAASRCVVSLSRFNDLIDAGAATETSRVSGKRIAFISGLIEESNHVITEEVMRCALKLQQDFNAQTYIFTGNLKVAGNGLETLYRRTKKAGTIYMKFTETTPDIQLGENGDVTITYVDEIIRERFNFNPDVTIIDEVFDLSAFSWDLSKELEIDTGPDGFIQSDNVHRATVFTNRKGIFVSGFSRGVQTKGDRQADVSSAAIAVLNLYHKPPESQTGKAEIAFTGHCVGCLTCFRSCPYGAISLRPKVAVDPQNPGWNTCHPDRGFQTVHHRFLLQSICQRSGRAGFLYGICASVRP